MTNRSPKPESARVELTGPVKAAGRKLIDIEELSQLWSIPRTTLYNWVHQRRLPHVKLGRCLRFDLAEIDRFRDRSTMGTANDR